MQGIRMVQQMMWQMGTLLASPVLWLVLAVLYWQHRRRSRQWRMLASGQRAGGGPGFLATMGMGLLGGLLASSLLLCLGISLEQLGLPWLWLAALALLLLRMRFVCVSYGGGLLVLCQLLFGWPSLDGRQLLMLVAVLHGTEALLVWCTGRWNTLPICVEGQDGRLTGAILIQVVWPLPLVLLAGLWSVQPAGGVVVMPHWWPLFAAEGQQIYWMVPVLAALGYRDVAVGCSVTAKLRQSALLLAGYGLTLAGLVLLSCRWPGVLPVAALFAPLGHEAMLWYGGRQSADNGRQTWTDSDEFLYSPYENSSFYWRLEEDGGLAKLLYKKVAKTLKKK